MSPQALPDCDRPSAGPPNYQVGKRASGSNDAGTPVVATRARAKGKATTMGYGALLVLVTFVGSVGCGHSEDEWQAMLARERSLRQSCQQATGSAASIDWTHIKPESCARDTDCKGDRICDLGRCTSPSK